jgi:serine/threonine protein kinase
LLFTILSGCFPYRGATDKELYKKIMNAEYRLPSEVKSTLSPEAINLLKRIFSIDANKRPSAKEVLNDPWLASDSSAFENP